MKTLSKLIITDSKGKASVSPITDIASMTMVYSDGDTMIVNLQEDAGFTWNDPRVEDFKKDFAKPVQDPRKNNIRGPTGLGRWVVKNMEPGEGYTLKRLKGLDAFPKKKAGQLKPTMIRLAQANEPRVIKEGHKYYLTEI